MLPADARRVPYLAGRRQGVTSYLDALLALYEARRDTHVQHRGFNAREKSPVTKHIFGSRKNFRENPQPKRALNENVQLYTCAPFLSTKKEKTKKTLTLSKNQREYNQGRGLKTYAQLARARALSAHLFQTLPPPPGGQ